MFLPHRVSTAQEEAGKSDLAGSLIGLASSFSKYRARGLAARATADLRNAATSEEVYFADNERYVTCADDACEEVLPGFVRSASVKIEMREVARNGEPAFIGRAWSMSAPDAVAYWDSMNGGLIAGPSPELVARFSQTELGSGFDSIIPTPELVATEAPPVATIELVAVPATPVPAVEPVAPSAELEDLYEKGRAAANRRDYVEAYAVFKVLADAGHPGGLYSLGLMYLQGDGVAKNRERAVELFEKAHAAGDPRAKKKLDSLRTGRR